MRFCDLFISYKIGLKSIKSTIPFTKLPLYRKIFVIIPGISEPPVRTLRATIPENERHIFR